MNQLNSRNSCSHDDSMINIDTFIIIITLSKHAAMYFNFSNQQVQFKRTSFHDDFKQHNDNLTNRPNMP